MSLLFLLLVGCVVFLLSLFSIRETRIDGRSTRKHRQLRLRAFSSIFWSLEGMFCFWYGFGDSGCLGGILGRSCVRLCMSGISILLEKQIGGLSTRGRLARNSALTPHQPSNNSASTERQLCINPAKPPRSTLEKRSF